MKCIAAVAAVGAGLASGESYQIPKSAGEIGQPFDGFVSYSIEFSSFPEFAGNKSAPNIYSYNLIKNLGDIMGSMPYVRVGGNTQDYALYNTSQPEALIGIIDSKRSPDYPTTIYIGKAYMQSYQTWPGVKFSHGFNMGLGGNRSEGWATLSQTVPLICEAIGHVNLYTWEYGNEPDLFSTSAQGPVRPPSWNETTYVQQWHNATKEIREQVKAVCPELAAQGQPKFMAPSNAGSFNHLKAAVAWEQGLNKYNDIEYFSTHNYISGAESPGVTLQRTLMNHTITKQSVDNHIAEYKKIQDFAGKEKTPPLIFGECNSLYNQGRPGLSNTFEAALWGIDFNLYSASVGFKRVHMHMGTNYRYQAWQPVGTDLGSIGTKAPYYGSIAVAAMLRNSASHPVSISSIPLSSDREAAYAAHFAPGTPSAGKLVRIMAINMHSYNTTADGHGLEPALNSGKRGVRSYEFSVQGITRNGQAFRVQRLLANGSDAITGITYDGWSYNRELDMGKPVRLDNVTIDEVVLVKDGVVTVEVPDSSAALLSFVNKCRT